MGKFTAKVISYGRYRFTDLLLFAIILLAFETIAYFAFASWFADEANYTFSIVTAISILVMLRWGWYGMFYAVVDGLFYCMLYFLTADGVTGTVIWQNMLIYGLGSAFVGLDYLMVKFIGWKKIKEKAWLTILYTVAGWLLISFGKSLVSTCLGNGFYDSVSIYMFWDLLSCVMCIVIMLIMRRSDGMMERQKDYLLRLEEERQEAQRIDTYGDTPIEIDPEDIKALNKKGNDLFE